MHILCDLQDLDDYWECDLDQAKTFIINIWANSEDEVPEDFFQEMEEANFNELKEILKGCDYGLFVSEKEFEDWKINNYKK